MKANLRPNIQVLPDISPPIYQCLDCGAHASRIVHIKHHPTCEPGSSKKWEKYYQSEGASR